MRSILLLPILALTGCANWPAPNPYAAAAVGNAMSHASANYYRQQQLQAYQHRTSVMGLPQHHRHSGSFDVYHY